VTDATRRRLELASALWASLLWASVPWLVGCEAEVDEVPEGALALVGQRPLGSEDVAEVQAQLDAYAQTRFRGPHGRRSLLEALVDTELLSQEAIDAGLARDPRVHWALVEEMATLELNAELQRRLPREEIAADNAALRAWYDAHLDAFTEPEERSMEGVRFDDLAQARAALERLQAGEVQLADLGEVVSTPLARRDDLAFPGFHSILFDAALAEGDRLPIPVVTDRAVVVGRVGRVVPATPLPFDDPQVRERLVNAVWEQRAEPVRKALMAELAERYPVGAP
jgi:hypothetical protein